MFIALDPKTTRSDRSAITDMSLLSERPTFRRRIYKHGAPSEHEQYDAPSEHEQNQSENCYALTVAPG